MKSLKYFLLAASVTVASIPATAQAQIWTDWISTTGVGGSVYGTMGAHNLVVTGDYFGYQLADGTMSTGTFVPNYGAGRGDFQWWNSALDTPSPAFTQGGLTPPPTFGLIQFKDAGSITIDFGGAVLNPFIAINSLGNPTQTQASMTFGPGNTSVDLISSNTGGVIPTYWGTGNCYMAGNVLTGAECSGVVRLNGTFSSLTISGTVENWYGITVGQQSVVPEPSTYALMIVGLAGLGMVARRKRTA